MYPISLTTGAACTWTASSNVGWLTVQTPSGTGSATTINVLVGTNNLTTSRDGTVTVGTTGNTTTFTITQSAAACTYSFASPSSLSVSADASSSPYTTSSLTTGATCTWTATVANDPSTGVPPNWLHITTPTGTGTSTIGFNVDRNCTTAARVATISAGGQSFTVTQARSTYSFSPTSVTKSPIAATSTFNVTVLTGSGCTWTAVSSDSSWLTTSSTGTTNGIVTYSVTLNSGSTTRTGDIKVGDQTFTVTQTACSYSINPGGHAFPKEGGEFTFNVNSNSCGWTAVSNAPSWVYIIEGSGGGVGGVVSFGVAENTGPPRGATITVAGLTFVVVQESGCNWNVSPTSVNVSANGGYVYVNVQRSNQACPIPVGTTYSWLTPVNQGCSDDPELPQAWRYCWVAIYVAPNTSQDARAGGVMIANQPFIVFQQGAEP